MGGFGGNSSGGSGGQDIVQRTKSASNKRNSQNQGNDDGGNDNNNQSSSQTYVAPKPVTPVTTGVANVAPTETGGGCTIPIGLALGHALSLALGIIFGPNFRLSDHWDHFFFLLVTHFLIG